MSPQCWSHLKLDVVILGFSYKPVDSQQMPQHTTFVLDSFFFMKNDSMFFESFGIKVICDIYWL